MDFFDTITACSQAPRGRFVLSRNDSVYSCKSGVNLSVLSARTPCAPTVQLLLRSDSKNYSRNVCTSMLKYGGFFSFVTKPTPGMFLGRSDCTGVLFVLPEKAATTEQVEEVWRTVVEIRR